MKHIRTAIFGLERSRATDEGLRNQLLSVAREAAGPLGFEPHLLFEGPIDAGMGDDVAAQLLAVVREALSNAARHAHASTVQVSVAVTGDEVRLEVTDDGIGPPPPGAPRGHGLDNMDERATRLGGSFVLSPRRRRLHRRVVRSPPLIVRPQAESWSSQVGLRPPGSNRRPLT